MSPLFLLLIILILFGGGWGSYRTYNSAGPWFGGGVGTLALLLVVVLIIGYR